MSEKFFRIRSPLTGMYVCEMRGVCFLTWVSEEDKSHAMQLNEGIKFNAIEWLNTLSSMAGHELELIRC